MYTIEQLEFSLLAWFWNVRYWRDRQGTAFSKDTNKVTGLPNSANDLQPGWRAISGDRLALEVTPIPGDLATSMIKYETSDYGGGVEMRELTQKPRHEWTAEEIEVQAELTHRIKIAAHRLASRGLINLQPNDDQDKPQALGSDGLTARFQLLPAGLEEAKKRVAGGKYDGDVRGYHDALTVSERTQAPQWMQDQWKHGGKEGIRSV